MAFSQSNLFLPLGKVRMGCPLGRSGWVILRGMLGWVRDRGWGLMPSDLFSFSVIILAVYRSICLRGGDASPPLYTVFCPVFGQARCPSGASTLPNKGKHVAPPGHISFSSRAQYPTFSSHQYLPISFLFPGNAISPICHPFPLPFTPSFPIHFRPRRQL